MKKTLPLLPIIILLITACGKKNEPDHIPVNTAAMVTTIAGSTIWGSANGTGASASFHGPNSLAVDASGNVYVADTYNHTIRKISPGGIVTTVAGSGTQGSANGTGTLASFCFPRGITVDAAGNIYVADTNNQVIRKISTGGVVTTFAGTGNAGSPDWQPSSFFYPNDVALDVIGNVYVADTDNQMIDKISSLGLVTGFAGNDHTTGTTNGTGSAASFSGPRGVTVDVDGNVYVADANMIRKISSVGVVTTLAGSAASGAVNGTGTSASFNEPSGVAVDAKGNVYVADTGNSLIRKISSNGVVTTLAGIGTIGSANGPGTSASFNYPYGVAVDATGNVYVADTDNNMIRKISYVK